MKITGAAQDTFALGWLEMPGKRRVSVGSVTLPDRPTTLGEARGGLSMIGIDESTTRWLQRWLESGGEERSILLRLPEGWFELCDATIALLHGVKEQYLVRFNRRFQGEGPEA
jgi:hypothetical protein